MNKNAPGRTSDNLLGQPSRERLLTLGAQALTDTELLALLLRNGNASQSANDVAREILRDVGGIHGLAEVRAEELAHSSGIGLGKATSVIAAFHLCARVRETAPSRVKLDEPGDIADAAHPLFVGLRVERLVVLVCDARDRIRRVVSVSEGWLDQVAMPTREVLNAVLRHDGRSFAMAHNHPSGDVKPSPADENATYALMTAAEAVGLRFLDHVVVAGEQWASVTSAERGNGTRRSIRRGSKG